jgi:hypothetical protein
VDCVLDDRGEVLIVEDAGQVDDRARRAGERDRSEHSTIIEVHGPSVDDHEP